MVKNIYNSLFFILVSLSILLLSATFSHSNSDATIFSDKRTPPTKSANFVDVSHKVLQNQSPLFSYVCPLGCPLTTDNRSIFLVIHKLYISALDRYSKLPIWVAYEVKPSYIGKRSSNYFRSDILLPSSFQINKSKYKNLFKDYSLDRGHLAPAGTFGNYYGKETFYLTNVLPQPLLLNRSAWKMVEMWERKQEHVFVIAGAVISRLEVLSNGMPKVDKFWKVIVLSSDKSSYYGLVFKKLGGKYCFKNVYLKKIEGFTNLSFFKYYSLKQKDLNIKGRCAKV